MILFALFLFHLTFDLSLDLYVSKSEKNGNDSQEKTSTSQTAAQPAEQAQAMPPEIVEKETLVSNLQAEIKELKEESEKYNNPSNYAKYSKMQRKMITLQKKLDEETVALQTLLANYKPVQPQENKVERAQPVQTDENAGQGIHDLVNKKKIIVRILKIALPALMYFCLPGEILTIKMDSSYLKPIYYFLGEQSGEFFKITSRLAWVIFCYRTINRLKKFITDLIFAPKSTTAAQQEKQKQE